MSELGDILSSFDKSGTEVGSEKIHRWSDIHMNWSPQLSSMLQSCTDHISLIETGEIIIALPEYKWGMEQLICVIGEQLGPIDLWVTVYAVSGESMARLAKAKKSGFVRNVRFVIDERTKTWKPQNYNLIENLCGKENIGIIKTHAKIFALKQVNGDRVVSIIGSANFSKTPGAEAMVIMTDDSVGEFLIDWMESKIK